MVRKIRKVLASDLALLSKLKYGWFAATGRGARGYTLRGGGRVQLRPGTTDERVFDEIFIERVYAPHVTMLPRAPEILDLGANIGLSTIFLLRAFPGSRATAVEPDGANFAMLLENLRSAGLAERCTALWAFAGAEPGFAAIEDSGNGAWGMRMGARAGSGIPVVPLAALAGSGGPVIVKCDIEGAERELFSRISEWEERVQFVILELHTELFPVDEFRRCLRSSRYDWTIHGELGKNSCISVIGLERGSRRDAEGAESRREPFVSVIVPCRNEARFVGRCLDSVLQGDYPAERMEVIVADGLSDDGTREIIAGYVARDSRVRLVDNPERSTPVALNRAIEASRGDVIARLDAHAEMTADYLTRCVESLERTGAQNVGGVRRELADRDSAFAGPILAALTHPFGVGNARYRFAVRAPRWVDTVFGGCWPRDVFDRIGPFNERLLRSQDMEFNQRLRRAGGKILLLPDIETRYYTRSTFGGFCRHAWANGVWAVLPFAYSDGMPVRWRHLAPLGLVVACLALSFAGPAGALFLIPYAALNLGVSLQVAVRQRDWRYAALLPVTFASLHLAYGAGSLWGAVQLALRTKKDYSTVTEQPLQLATRGQMKMLSTRYAWAAEHASGKDVLEVACGAGLGLGLLARGAASVEAGDLDESNCRIARATHPKIRVRRMDATELPFPDESFDLALLFEAIYYLPDAPRFFREAHRVLRPGATLLVSTVNREWLGFHPSPFHSRYLSATELKQALADCGFGTRLYAGFPESPGAIRRAAVSLGLVPRTMRGKALLKRLVYGPLERIPAQIDSGERESLVPVDPELDLTGYRVLYVEAHK